MISSRTLPGVLALLLGAGGAVAQVGPGIFGLTPPGASGGGFLGATPPPAGRASLLHPTYPARPPHRGPTARPQVPMPGPGAFFPGPGMTPPLPSLPWPGLEPAGPPQGPSSFLELLQRRPDQFGPIPEGNFLPNAEAPGRSVPPPWGDPAKRAAGSRGALPGASWPSPGDMVSPGVSRMPLKDSLLPQGDPLMWDDLGHLPWAAPPVGAAGDPAGGAPGADSMD